MQLWDFHQALKLIAMPGRQEGKQVHVFDAAHLALNRWRADLKIVGDICIDHKPGGLDRVGLHQPVIDPLKRQHVHFCRLARHI